jgi:hypothetical protein
MPKKELQDRIKAKEASSSEGPMNPIEPKSEAAAEEGGVNERNGPQHQKRKGGHGQEAKAKVPRCSPSRRSLKEELMSRIGHEAKDAKKKTKRGSEVGKENPQDQEAKDDEQNADAAFDDDPQLPGKTGATQAIKDRMQAESRGQTIAAIAINADHHKDDDRQPDRKYPRSSSIGRSSDRGRLIEAITDQIKLNKAVAEARKRDEQQEVGSEAMQANSAKVRKKGDATVQGREVEQKHVHASTKCEFNAISRKLATTSGTSSSEVATHNSSTNERLMRISRPIP